MSAKFCTRMTTSPKKNQTFIHVNSHVIRRNMRQGTNDPPVIIRRSGGRVELVHDAEIRVNGMVVARVVYNKDTPLKCGATVWIETDYDVVPLIR